MEEEVYVDLGVGPTVGRVSFVVFCVGEEREWRKERERKTRVYGCGCSRVVGGEFSVPWFFGCGIIGGRNWTPPLCVG